MSKIFSKRRCLAIETVYNDYECPTWPCNSLVIETSEGLSAFVNSNSDGRFIHSLESYGIKVIGVPFHRTARLAEGYTAQQTLFHLHP